MKKQELSISSLLMEVVLSVWYNTGSKDYLIIEFAAKVIQKLWETVPNLMDRVDMIMGGSGGAVVAAGLAHGLSPKFSKKIKKFFLFSHRFL